ncbi:kinase-like domain-containing protein [Schizophyllum commune]|nr:kinase-like protein [Schizophyllum commune Loenen D]
MLSLDEGSAYSESAGESEGSWPDSEGSASQLDEQDDEQIPYYLGHYYLQDLLGSGYSGSIYRAVHVHNGKTVALKVQDVHHECPTNRYERAFYPLLQGGVGMPTMWEAGVQGKWDYLAIDLLGPSLDQLYRKHGKGVMDLRSVISIAIQLISRLELMHARGVLHRDIQLGNCTIGLPPFEKTIYMIDFGFSKLYIDPVTRRHIPDSKKPRDFIGNYWFSSVAVHCRGKVPSRRDDMEAAALMLIHLLTPNGLSWTRNGVPKTDEAHDRLKREKKNARPEDLCRGLPSEFEEFLRYCRRLNFMDRPDYQRWKDEFAALAEEQGFGDCSQFEWPPRVLEKPSPRVIATPKRSLAPPPSEEMNEILRGLQNLNLAPPDREVLGDRKNIQRAARQAEKKSSMASSETKNNSNMAHSNTLVPSNDTNANSDVVYIKRQSPAVGAAKKADLLRQLRVRVSSAATNEALAEIVAGFVEALRCNSSKTLTNAATDFLDALQKQLAQPSVFEVPVRTSQNSRASVMRTRSREESQAKLGILARLKHDVRTARNNAALAAMVDDFSKATNKTSGKTITKDGFAFLEGLSQRLKEMR